MEKSFFCYEQVYQMQATYEAIVMLKITHDAGYDVVTNPISFLMYNHGEQMDVFVDCLKIIFGECKLTADGEDENGDETCTYSLPLKELNLLSIIPKKERKLLLKSIDYLLERESDYGEGSMSAVISNSAIVFTLTGYSIQYSSMFKNLVKIRKAIVDGVSKYTLKMQNNLRNVFMVKMVTQNTGFIPSVSIGEDNNIVFSQLVKLCGLEHVINTSEPKTYEGMIHLLDLNLKKLYAKEAGVA